MNMKDTMILLIFLLAILGLCVGVYHTSDAGSGSSHESSFERLHEENGSVLTVTWQKKDNNDLNDFFTGNRINLT